jgi:hypothetical protein
LFPAVNIRRVPSPRHTTFQCHGRISFGRTKATARAIDGHAAVVCPIDSERTLELGDAGEDRHDHPAEGRVVSAHGTNADDRRLFWMTLIAPERH